ncbi:glycerol-3-phosphate dehydrogenase [Ascoidea rubescens DSM 1968]|uniref:Glycerol-3-phosphate dehydrogenase n=1 Tax=Ascoidea rubescens DSM 1968 TaxID=1344418 RepID=A0A1D2VDR7_9ASCO|nr:glycerol-3-phosphate dehydrogenase mitochondrial precursor [Ascoidea rubescens DSM 1968]ODV59834.1 glycerol-3-phosphate dehydrogenase mitochondrial precursor [Ascoidea rubescens DSM 1968]
MASILSKRFVKTGILTASLVSSGYLVNSLINDNKILNDEIHKPSTLDSLTTSRPPPLSRSDLLSKLSSTPYYDLIVIGGGATGTGTALDAQTRGLNVALFEKNDFASGTSSKSTKMAHGGVRYLEKAFWQLSKDQLDLVIEALNERSNILRTAPHLATILPIMIPVYNYWQIPYFYIGTKMYDFFAGSQNLKSSYLLSSNAAQEVAPMLDGSILKAGLVYHDGLFNDSRMNSTLALTAIEKGATVLNYMEVKQLIKNEENKVIGVKVVDAETGKEYNINSTAIVNATGPFSDKILEMDNDINGLPPLIKQLPKMVVPSSGVHLILPEFYCPKKMGLLDASTSDGRVMFFLPWQGKVLAGTTDTPIKEIPDDPIPKEEEIQDILNELQHYINFPVKREDVLSAWSGVRPLVRDPSKIKKGEENSTQGIVRNHLIYKSETGLITISGGKWTTYREMAEVTVDNVVKNFKFNNIGLIKECQTKKIVLSGGENFDSKLPVKLIHKYSIPNDIAEHLSTNYGSRAPIILEIYKENKENQLPITLVGKDINKEASYEKFDLPFTVAELKYSIKYEYARTPIDFLARRTRLAFLNAKESLNAIDGTIEIMGKELKWNKQTKEEMRIKSIEFLKSMGISEPTA